MDVKRTVTYDLADYLGMARRSWWVLVLCIALGVGAAYVYTGHEPKEYESTTKVQVLPTTQDANAASGRTTGSINLDTEAQLVQSVNVAQKAHDLMQSPLSPDALLKNVSVTVPPNSTVLEITYAANTAAAAQAGSHAFAEGYLSYRGDSDKAAIASQVSGLQTQMKPLQTPAAADRVQAAHPAQQLAGQGVSGGAGEEPAGSAEHAGRESEHAELDGGRTRQRDQ